MSGICEYFGSMSFDDRAMRARLPGWVYDSLARTRAEGLPLDARVADEVAAAMKDWALERGATHFTHWFQPMTGVTAEKHDGFIAPAPDGGVLMEFSGRELIRGEPDASSFPSGGLRATFEARGYTAWDPTSNAFIKDRTLCIPTAFCSYGGEALDKKTPLLRSMDALSREALRVLRLFGDAETKRVLPSVGPEQEYFLVDAELYKKRPDLVCTGRTLFGARPPKGQELDDHYFGSLKPRVEAYMRELDEELWKLGVLVKTEHNEVAPAQHELAPIYGPANIATDHNQLTMEVMRKVASRHGLVCLLHEKPFAGLNGSGKHNNWSLTTDSGTNLLAPGETPQENAQFLTFLCAVVEAVDEYQDLLRLSVATAGNDCRLGANEAPPAVVSIYLGSELSGILDFLERGEPCPAAERSPLRLGVEALPRFLRDSTDRNRTSPFAFTGNKFEFRMLGSSNSIACANIMLNSAVAAVLRRFADSLEGAEDFGAALRGLLRDSVAAHRRIVFDGNGYDAAWLREAEARGLSNPPSTPDCMPRLLDEKNVRMLTSLGVYTEAELRSRYEIMLENYCKSVTIEALTMCSMARRDILPAVERYAAETARAAAAKRELEPDCPCAWERSLVRRLSELCGDISAGAEALESGLESLHRAADVTAESRAIRDGLLPRMEALRAAADEAERLTAAAYWPYPSYSELLYSV